MAVNRITQKSAKKFIERYTPKNEVQKRQLIEALKHRWSFYSRKEQVAPEGLWSIWVYLAGRGAGKTRAGAEWVRQNVERGWSMRAHLIAPTAADCRDTMVEGPAGILSVCPKSFKPLYEPSKRKLTWPNGAVALLFSGDEPERLRGPQCDLLWADELFAWRRPDTWDMAMFGLRLGTNPRALVTSTPKPCKLIKTIMAMEGTVVTRGSTYDNRKNLAATFFDTIITRYEGTRLGRQELLAEILEDNPNALWKVEWLERGRVLEAPEAFAKVSVGVDPATTSKETSDETGIVVAGRDYKRGYYVLDDVTMRGTPHEWAYTAIAAYHRWRANTIVAESNQGGEMVAATIHNVDANVPVKLVHASKAKRVRAEPVSALYEQNHVHHVGVLSALENELCDWDPMDDKMGSPNRLDALVWAITDLIDIDAVALGGFDVSPVTW